MVPDVSTDERAYAVYTLIVRITDSIINGEIQLNSREASIIDEAEQWIEQKLPQLAQLAAV